MEYVNHRNFLKKRLIIDNVLRVLYLVLHIAIIGILIYSSKYSINFFTLYLRETSIIGCFILYMIVGMLIGYLFGKLYTKINVEIKRTKALIYFNEHRHLKDNIITIIRNDENE